MITARFGSSSVTVGAGVEMRVITATIIGGASLSGGEGSVLGAFLGALFMGVLANALNLLGVDVYWQNLVTGANLDPRGGLRRRQRATQRSPKMTHHRPS